MSSEVVQGVVSGLAPRRLLTDEAVNSVCIHQRPTVTLVGHTHWQTEPECNSDSDCFIVKA